MTNREFLTAIANDETIAETLREYASASLTKLVNVLEQKISKRIGINYPAYLLNCVMARDKRFLGIHVGTVVAGIDEGRS